MVKKLYEVEHDDNLHMADAKGVPGGKRSLLYDDDEHLKEHAVLHEVSEDELEEKYRRKFEEEYRKELTPEQKERYQWLVDFGAELIIRGAEIAAPYVKKAFKEEVIPRGKRFAGVIRDKIKTSKRDQLKNHDTAQGDRLKEEKATLSTQENSTSMPSSKQGKPSESTNENGNCLPASEMKTITEDEAMERIANIMLLAQTVADECADLRYCRVEKTKENSPEIKALVGTDTLNSYVHAALDGEGRFFPESTIHEFLKYLYSEETSKAITELPLDSFKDEKSN